MNVYRYVWNSPQSWTDPTGLVAAAESGSTSRTAVGLIGPLAVVGQRVACIFGTVAGVLNAINEVTGDPSVTLERVEILSVACGARAIVKKKRRKRQECKAPASGPGRFLSAFFSFPKGTFIWGEDGFVPIEDVTVGDLVWSRDEETGVNRLSPVTELLRRETKEMTILRLIPEAVENQLMRLTSMESEFGKGTNPHTIRLTPEHPVYVLERNGNELGWVLAGNLMPGDLVSDIDGGLALEVLSNQLTAVSENRIQF